MMFGFKTRKQEAPTESEMVEEYKPYRKYDLLPAERVTSPDGSTHLMHRIKALIDIPEHGVKIGDVGGYISEEEVLAHHGSCWVGGNAKVTSVYGRINVVTDQALVTDEAFVSALVRENSRVSGNAVVNVHIAANSDISGDSKLLSGTVGGSIITRGNVTIRMVRIFGEAGSSLILDGNISIEAENKDDYHIHAREYETIEIKGNVSLHNVNIAGNCRIDAEVNLEGVSFKGDTTILGKPQIKPEVKFTGKNVISGDTLIPPGTHVHDVHITGGVLNYGGMSSFAAPPAAVNPEIAPVGFSVSAAETQEYVGLIEQIESEYEAYTTDIVKLIKYPAMVDTSVREVGEFVVKLRSAKRVIATSNADKIKEAAESLELAFVNAENRVQILVSSHLDDAKKKSLKDAEKMFQLACNDASTEPEKKLSYKAGMRSLEGIIVVSDKATEKLKERIGILELES